MGPPEHVGVERVVSLAVVVGALDVAVEVAHGAAPVGALLVVGGEDRAPDHGDRPEDAVVGVVEEVGVVGDPAPRPGSMSCMIPAGGPGSSARGSLAIPQRSEPGPTGAPRPFPRRRRAQSGLRQRAGRRARSAEAVADREVLDAGHEVDLGPLGSPAGSMASTRSRSLARSVRISRRANWAPRQKCAPTPNESSLSASGRRTSKRIGSTNTSSSRLADGYDSSTASAGGDRHAARPRWSSLGVAHEVADRASSSGSSRRRRARASVGVVLHGPRAGRGGGAAPPCRPTGRTTWCRARRWRR